MQHFYSNHLYVLGTFIISSSRKENKIWWILSETQFFQWENRMKNVWMHPGCESILTSADRRKKMFTILPQVAIQHLAFCKLMFCSNSKLYRNITARNILRFCYSQCLNTTAEFEVKLNSNQKLSSVETHFLWSSMVH